MRISYHVPILLIKIDIIDQSGVDWQELNRRNRIVKSLFIFHVLKDAFVF